jgi:uncharacterized membrane protein YjjB (DUF3815 family)
VQVVCAAVISVAFAVMSYATGRAVAVAGAAGALGWIILATGERVDLGGVTSSALAALVIGFAARLLARRARISALAVTTAAIVPLLPGRKAYEGISLIVTQPEGLGFSSGLPILAEAFGLGLGLAAGVSLGTYFAGLVVARRLGLRPGQAAGARLPADPSLLAAVNAPILSDTGELPRVEPGTGPTR